MYSAKTRLVAVVASAVTLFVASRVHADYMSANVPLIREVFGQNVGNVLAEADTGSAAINGLQPGQARLTLTVNPVSDYTQNGANVGFTSVTFFTNLPITPTQVTGPAGWSVLPPISAPSGVTGQPPYTGPLGWELTAPSDAARASTVSVLISGLGSSATLDHFLTPLITNLPNQWNTTVFQGSVAYDGSGLFPTYHDPVIAPTAGTAPEPSSLALSAVGLAGVALVRRWRANARR